MYQKVRLANTKYFQLSRSALQSCPSAKPKAAFQKRYRHAKHPLKLMAKFLHEGGNLAIMPPITNLSGRTQSKCASSPPEAGSRELVPQPNGYPPSDNHGTAHYHKAHVKHLIPHICAQGLPIIRQHYVVHVDITTDL